MPETGTSGSMSGDGKRSVGHRPQATALILDSTRPAADNSKGGGELVRYGTAVRRDPEARSVRKRSSAHASGARRAFSA